MTWPGYAFDVGMRHSRSGDRVPQGRPVAFLCRLRQRSDRMRQALLSAGGAALVSAAAVCAATSLGPMANRRRDTTLDDPAS